MENRRRSQNRRPPRGGGWQPTVPLWEKTFCKVVGSLDWGRLMSMKRYMHLYDNVLNWNDSACEEAFQSAKNRFWSHINGLPCENDLPDPDLYIDKIDWESEIDPELLWDLECNSMVPDVNEKHETVVILPEELMPYYDYSPTGWGEPEENFPKPPIEFDNPWEQNKETVGDNNEQGDYGNGGGPTKDSGWDNSWVPTQSDNNKVKNESQNHTSLGSYDGWGMWDSGQQKSGNADDGWGTWDSGQQKSGNADDGWGTWDSGQQKSGNANADWGTWDSGQQNRGNAKGDWGTWDADQQNRGNAKADWGTWDADQQNRGNATRYMSRYKISRFPREGQGHHNTYSWRNGKGTKGEARVWQ